MDAYDEEKYLLIYEGNTQTNAEHTEIEMMMEMTMDTLDSAYLNIFSQRIVIKIELRHSGWYSNRI